MTFRNSVQPESMAALMEDSEKKENSESEKRKKEVL